MGVMAVAVLAIVPQLLIVALSPLLSERYPLSDALAYGFIAFPVLLLPYALGLVVSSLIDDDTTSRLTSIFFLVVMLALERMLDLPSQFAYYQLLSGASYFVRHAIPWAGMGACLLASAALTWVAVQIVERRDY